MKNQVFAATIVAGVAIALAVPSVSPAGSNRKAPPPPPAKTKTKAPPTPAPPATPPATPPAQPQPPSGTGTGSLIMRAPALRQVQRLGTLQIQPTPAQIADQEVCLFQNANFGGWKYCTNLKGLQALPARFVGQATSMTVPDGYLLRLYQRADRRGVQCVFYGQVGAVSRDCDNMTAAISFETDPEWPAKQAAAQRARDELAAANAREQQRAEREAEAARVAAQEQADRDATLAEARRIIERDRAEAQAREAEAQAREAEARGQEAATASHLASVPECAVLVSESDGDLFSDASGSTTKCYKVNVGMTFVGGALNDDIERVEVRNRWVVFIGYEDANFEGRSIRLTCGKYELVGDPENEISSVKIELLSRPATCDFSRTPIVNRWHY
jgi:hypothetical protein